MSNISELSTRDQEKIQELLNKDLSELSSEDKAHLFGRRSYLKESEKSRYKEILEEQDLLSQEKLALEDKKETTGHLNHTERRRLAELKTELQRLVGCISQHLSDHINSDGYLSPKEKDAAGFTA